MLEGKAEKGIRRSTQKGSNKLKSENLATEEKEGNYEEWTKKEKEKIAKNDPRKVRTERRWGL